MQQLRASGRNPADAALTCGAGNLITPLPRPLFRCEQNDYMVIADVDVERLLCPLARSSRLYLLSLSFILHVFFLADALLLSASRCNLASLL